jgi:hypothetical protein
MKNKDQTLLEQAYEDILLNEKINWKGALTAAAVTAAGLIGGNSQANASEIENSKSQSRLEQSIKLSAEDLIPRAEFDRVLDLMKQQVAKGDLKSVKQIYNIIQKECTDATTKVSGSNEIRKLAAMNAEALKIWNDAYLGIVKSGLGSMADSIKNSSN